MAALPILCYPDPRLHTVAKPVVAVNDAVRRLVADMAQTMYEAPGIGLAATQVRAPVTCTDRVADKDIAGGCIGDAQE